MTIDEQVAQLAAGTIQRLQQENHTLHGAPGPKALLRRFGEGIARLFGLTRLDAVRIIGQGESLSFKRRAIKIARIEAFSDELLQQTISCLGWSDRARAELREGALLLTVGTTVVYATLVDDSQCASGTLLLWQEQRQSELTGSAKTLASLQRDYLVRTVQNESRWLRKLDQTQARLYLDDLTGLYNYRYLEIALDHELRRAERFPNNFCLLFLDLDGFKPINDQHGHFTGSSVLKQVADVLREVLREVDIPIRYGGDEFVVLLLGASCAKGVLAAERVRKRIADRAFSVDGGGSTHLTVSIGVAAYPEHARDRDSLLKIADETMYSSKRNGKNRVTVVGPTHPAKPL